MAVLRITDPYSRGTSFVYDRVVGPIAASFAGPVGERILARLPPASEVLDVGCGGGHLALDVARTHPGLRVSGVDLSADQIRRARRRDPEGKVSWEVADAMDLPFPDATFDLVVSVGSIKHWPDPGRGLDECVRVLRPGGWLVVAEVDRGCRFEDAVAFVKAAFGPAWPAALLPFMAFVAGRSLDLDDARALSADLALDEASVERVEGTPALALVGRRPS